MFADNELYIVAIQETNVERQEQTDRMVQPFQTLLIYASRTQSRRRRVVVSPFPSGNGRCLVRVRTLYIVQFLFFKYGMACLLRLFAAS